jgi:AAA family ATP:ADP antiporter
MILAQFWSFANDVYTEDEGERLFPIVGFGASLGAVMGALSAGLLIQALGIYQVMLVGAVLLIAEVQITNYLDKKERSRTEAHLPEYATTALMPAATAHRRDRETGVLTLAGEPQNDRAEPAGAFAMVFRTRYLLLVAFLMLFSNWVNTTGEYILGSVVGEAAQEAVALGKADGLTVKEYIGRFYSQFFGVVNIAGLVMQLFLVSRIVKYLGVRIAVLILPFTSLAAYNLLAFVPLLAVVRWAKTAENSTDYSLNNTVRNMLFLPCTREQKYVAKQTIDSFFVRAGDVLSAGVVFLGTTYFALSANGFAKFNAGLVVIWIVIAVLVGREYQRLVATGQPAPVAGKSVPASQVQAGV